MPAPALGEGLRRLPGAGRRDPWDGIYRPLQDPVLAVG